MINRETLQSLVTRQPFESFVVRLSGGESFKVRHPETLALGKSRFVVFDPVTDKMTICSLLHVTSIETLQSA